MCNRETFVSVYTKHSQNCLAIYTNTWLKHDQTNGIIKTFHHNNLPFLCSCALSLSLIIPIPSLAGFYYYWQPRQQGSFVLRKQQWNYIFAPKNAELYFCLNKSTPETAAELYFHQKKKEMWNYIFVKTKMNRKLNECFLTEFKWSF